MSNLIQKKPRNLCMLQFHFCGQISCVFPARAEYFCPENLTENYTELNHLCITVSQRKMIMVNKTSPFSLEALQKR